MKFLILIFFVFSIFSKERLQIPLQHSSIESEIDSLINHGIFDFMMCEEDDSTIILNTMDAINTVELSFVVDGVDTFINYPIRPPLTSDKMVSWLYGISKGFADNGYPFALTRISRFNISNVESGLKADIEVDIVRNEKVMVEDIHIHDPIRTKPSSIRRQMLLQSGGLYRLGDIEKGIMRVNRKGIVRIAGGHNIARDSEGLWFVAVSAVDIAKSSAEGLVTAYRGADENIELGGELSGSLNNIWGLGREFNLNWRRLSKDNTNIELGAYDPHFGNSLIGLGARFNERGRTGSKKRNLTLRAEYPLGFVFEAITGISFDWVIPDSTGLWTMKIPHQQSTGLILGTRISTIDDRGFPESGFHVDLNLIGKHHRFDAPSTAIPKERLEKQYDLSINSAGLYVTDISIAKPLVRFGLNGVLLSTADVIPLSQVAYLGGFNSVRGHVEDEVFGDRAFYAMTEIRFHLADRSAVFPFIDFGLYERDGFSHIYGYGFGILTDTAIGVVSISYGLSPEREIADGLLHFGIRSEF